MGIFLRFGILAVAVAASAPALADSRLFSVKADVPGITVEEALVDGKPLAVSGKGGGVTFFRLDAPGDVPCAQRVTFVASNGARQDADVALCPQNWNFAISFAGPGGAPPAVQPTLAPPAAAEGEPPAPPATAPPGTRTITIATDDPQVGIEEVFIDRQPAQIVDRQGNGVEVQVAGGGVCQRDVGLKLSDGRTIARMLDLCSSSGSVLVTLGSGGSQAAGSQQPSAPAQPAMPAQPPLPPEQAAQPVVAAGVWTYRNADGNAILSFGLPESDDGTFAAACRLGTSKATVDVLRMVEGLAENAPVQVTFFVGAFTKTYPAKGSPYMDMDGGSHPVFSIPVGDPLWSALAKEAQAVVSIAGGESFALTLKGSSAAIRPFLAACAPAPPPPPPAASAGPGAVRYACDDGSSLMISFGQGLRSAYVVEPGAPPVELVGGPTGPDSARFSAPPAQLVGAGESIRWSHFGEPPRTCYPQR